MPLGHERRTDRREERLRLQDPNSNKDITGRFGAESKIGDTLIVSGGVSYNRGKGFHAGTDATKDTLTWTDRNSNGNVDTGETTGNPGTAAVPSVNLSAGQSVAASRSS
jgi:hypothetical protein